MSRIQSIEKDLKKEVCGTERRAETEFKIVGQPELLKFKSGLNSSGKLRSRQIG